VDLSAEELRTDLLDLTDTSIDDLHRSDGRLLAVSLSRILRQIDRPRVNIGSSPPGRVD
jgi:hypothetical protein